MEVDYSYKFLNSYILKLAIAEAERSEHQHRIGCVIFNKKKIISSSHNSVRANKIPNRWKNYYESSHAEAKAILDARCNLSACSLLVVRLNKSGKLLNSKPCDYCQGFIEHVSIGKVFYSTQEGKIVQFKS